MAVSLDYQRLVTAAVIRHIGKRDRFLTFDREARREGGDAAVLAWLDWWTERHEYLVRMRRASNLEDFLAKEYPSERG